LPLKSLAVAFLVAGVYCLITGVELFYNTFFILYNTNLLFLVFLVIGLLFLAASRGLIKLEKWARAFCVFIFVVLILSMICSYQSSHQVPFIVLVLLSVTAIVYLKKHRTVSLFEKLMPVPLKHAINYGLLILFGVGMLFPFIWMLSTSVKQKNQIRTLEWLPVKKFIELDGQNHEIKIRREQVEITYQQGVKKGQSDTLLASAPKIVHTKGWLLPWQIEKWKHVIEEDGSVVPVTIDKRICTIKIIDKNSPRWKERIKGVESSQIFSKIVLSWENYPNAYKAIKMGLLYWNSTKVVVLITLGQVFTSSLAGYAFSRLKFRGREQMFFGYLATMMVPGAVTMIPLYILCRKLGLVNTHTAIILPGMFTAYGTFMLRQFFMSIPKDLEDAAKIDGCSLFGIYWRIIIPLAKPAMATLATFTFMWNWRNFLWPLIVLNDQAKMTLPIGLQSFMSLHGNEWTLLMAGSMMYVIPIMLVFIFNQRFFIKGIQLGAIKG